MPTKPQFQRPATAPDFLLSRAHGSIRTQGARAVFTSARAAVDALASGTPLIVGALPFRPDQPAHLVAPVHVIEEPSYLTPPAYYQLDAGATPTAAHTSSTGGGARITGFTPSPAQHAERIRTALGLIDSGVVDKVVLARRVDIEFESPVDSRLLAARLISHSTGHDGFMADLGGDRVFFGSSPEMLIRRQGDVVTAFPLAGSLPRVEDPAEDAARGRALASSQKDVAEHAFVVEHYRRVLDPLCEQLEIPAAPSVMSTREMWHLATPIRGRLRPGGPSALELATLLHPTPAVGGTPTAQALEVIGRLEEDRGFYAGAVGYCRANGDGEFMVAIRCAELSGDARHARAWAGGGIVAGSDPDSEVAETRGKLRTALRAMGVSE